MSNKNVSITLLGTGTSQGIPIIACECKVCTSTDSRDVRMRSSAMFTIDGMNLVVDTGPDFRMQMLQNKVKKIDGILVTHEHNDHIAGLDDIRPFNFKYNMDMPLYGQQRVLDAMTKRFSYIFTDYPGVPKITTHPKEANSPFEVNGVSIIPIEVMHGKMPIYGYRIGDVTYLTDVKTMSPDAIELVKGSKVLVINTLRYKEHHSHLNLDEALELISEIGAEQTYLTHISHFFDRHEDIQKLLPTNVFVGYDGLKISL